MNNIYMRESHIDKSMFVVMVYSEFQGLWRPSNRMQKKEAEELVNFYKKNERGL
jgi:hypothetical protein